MKKDIFIGAILFVAIGILATGLMGSAPNSLPTPKSGISVNLEVADTEELQAKGLAGHAPLKEDDGMLFVFETPQVACMWNKDVDFPVSVGFFDKEWRLINAEEMAANSTKKTCSSTPVKFAIEMRAGWFNLKHKETSK